MDNEQQSDPNPSNGDIVSFNQSPPSLDPIQTTLYEKMKLV